MKPSTYFTVITLLCSSALLGQTVDVVTMGPNYDDQSFYSLSNGEVSVSLNTNWDVAFTLSAASAAVRTNDGMGALLYKYPNGDINSWAEVDTLGMSAWPQLRNQEDSWSGGAFNANQDGFYYGWGTYDVISHVVTGDSIYLLKTIDGEWKKLIIEQLEDGVFGFTHADLDGENEVTSSIDQTDFAGKNFAYHSLSSNTTIDREPLASEWELTFTKYLALVAPGVYYSVVGALSNNNIEVAEANDLSEPLSYSDYGSQDFLLEMNAIGSDWKSFNIDTFSYDLVGSRCYFVKDLDGDIYRLVFTDFVGSSTGEITINKELISGSSVLDVSNQQNSFVVYPNPASGNATIVVDAQSDQVRLSICDVSGKKMMDAQLLNGFQATSVSLSDFEKGLYFVSITLNGATSTQRLIVQ